MEKVGGKSASLGEMISQLSDVGVPVPGRTSNGLSNLSLFIFIHTMSLTRWLQYHRLCLQGLFGQRLVCYTLI